MFPLPELTVELSVVTQEHPTMRGKPSVHSYSLASSR
jgi:hypothetical protein